MTQSEYLRKLEGALKNNGISRIHEILADYQEHFAMGISNGKTEAEISQKLGEPETIAGAYHTEDMIREIKSPESNNFSFSSALTILGRLIILAPLNFIVFLIPGLVLLSLLAAGWAVAAAFFATSLAIISATFAIGILSISFWAMVASSAGSLSLLGLTVLVGFFMYFVSKHLILASISYLQWNLKFILQK